MNLPDDRLACYSAPAPDGSRKFEGMTPALTEKEQQLLDRIKKGMDTPGEGWLHEMIPKGMSPHSAAGVLGSLIAKGLVTSVEDKESGRMTCYWIELTNAAR